MKTFEERIIGAAPATSNTARDAKLETKREIKKIAAKNKLKYFSDIMFKPLNADNRKTPEKSAYE
ncbi:MAG: hypothetical protein Fur0012_14720 [Elusimicrobiota bacterium]